MSKKIAIIGSSGAIGSQFVLQYNKREDIEKIYAFSRSEIKFDSPKIISLKIDLEDENSIKTASEKIEENLDLIIVSSGILHNQDFMPEKSMKEMSKEKFEKVFLINTFGPALVMKYFAPKLKQDEKSIFSAISARVSSISDNYLGGWYSYRASKAALNMILKNLAIELKRTNKNAIVAGLHPGTVNSNLSKPFQGAVKKDKLFSPEYSVSKLIKVLDEVKNEDSGFLFDYDGEKIEF